jgi:hypothetical protein
VIAALSLAALTCWLVRPLVVPRWRFGADDVERYLRVLGGQRRLTALALVLTVAAIVAIVVAPNAVNPDLRDLRRADASCSTRQSQYNPPTCYALEAGGQWVEEEMRPDKTRVVIATVATPEWWVAGQNPAADAAQEYRQEMDAAAAAGTLLAASPFAAPPAAP